MNIGKPKRTYTVEPLQDPIPKVKPNPAPQTPPQRPLPARQGVQAR